MKWMFSLQKNSKQYLNSLLIQSRFLNISILKLFKKGVTPLLCALTCFNLCSISSFALWDEADYVFKCHTNEPFVSDLSGYVFATRKVSQMTDFLFYWVATNSLVIQDTDNQNVTLNPNVADGYSGTIIDYDYYYPTLAENLNVQVVFRNTGITFYFQSIIPCTILIYAIPNYGDNTGIERYKRLDIISDEWYTYTYSWGYDNASTPFGYAYGRYTSIDKGTTNMNTRVEFYNEWNLNSTLDLIKESIGTDSPSAGNSDSFVDSTQITDIATKEEELLSENLSNDLDNMEISINPNSSAVCWGIIDDVMTSNSKVFSMFLSILAIGIIGLILNR